MKLGTRVSNFMGSPKKFCPGFPRDSRRRAFSGTCELWQNDAMLRTLHASRWNKEKFDVFEAKLDRGK